MRSIFSESIELLESHSIFCAQNTHQKTSFYHKTFFTTEAQKNDFEDLNSGIYITFYREQESWRDFDPGEALIAVIANQIFWKMRKIWPPRKSRKIQNFQFFRNDPPGSQEGFCGSELPDQNPPGPPSAPPLPPGFWSVSEPGINKHVPLPGRCTVE